MINANGKNASHEITALKAETVTGIANVKTGYGAVGDYNPTTGLGTDDTQAFINAIAASNVIFIPAGSYKVSESLNLKDRIVISGVYKQSKIYFTKDNATLFVGSIDLFPTTSFYYGMIQNLDIIGLGKTFNQKGMNLDGYLSHVNGVGISKFNRGVELRGVQFSFDDCYIQNNGTGVSIQDAIKADGTADYNTLLHFKHINFLQNDLGMANTGEGQVLTGGEKNVIDLSLEKCIFEQNTKGFAIIPFTGSMRECWFENNTNRSTTRKFSWLIENNRYSTNGGDNTIDYLTTAGTSEFYGTVELVPAYGVAHARTFDFQNYDTTGLDISTRQLKEQKRASITSAVGVVDATDATTRELTELNPMTLNNGTTQVLMNKITQLSILPDGTIYARATDPKYTGYSVTKITTGRYKVVLHTTHFRGMPQIFVTSPTAVNSDALQDTFYYTTHMGNASDLSAYATQGYFTAIYIDAYKRPSGGGADVLADAWIFMTLYHA